MLNYKPCPKCSSSRVKKVGFTWWGGVLGPNLLTHVKCEDCGSAYNGKTGESNTGAIITYNIVLGVIVLGAVFLVFSG
jgi:transposase-like protein